MDNKKYLDKVLDHLVRSTKIDYENERVSTPLSSSSLYFLSSTLISSLPSYPSPFFCSVSDYCGNQFGLTDAEIDYVWDEYKNIILDKIKNNEQ